MEPFNFNSGKLKGVEVLFFDDVEIQKVKGNQTSFASSGSLSVLYFKNFDRFVLRLNDWVYPLMRRIPITSESGSNSATFTLPASNGFNYRLIFSNAQGQAFSNFQTILSNNSGFTLPGIQRTLESSPDDKLTRHRKSTDLTSTTSNITGMIKSSIDKVKTAAMGLGTKKSVSTKKRIHMKDIKNKNYRKSAQSSFKKNYLESELNLTKKFVDHRKNNPNLSESKDLKELKKTSDNVVPTLFFGKEEIEEAILKQKDLITERNFTLSESAEKKSIMGSIKSGLTGLKDQVTGLVHREVPKTNIHEQISGQHGLTEHYSG